MVEEDEDDADADVTPVPVEPKSGDAEPPTVKAIEVDVISDPQDTEPVVGHGIGSLLTPPFLTIYLLLLQADLVKDEPVPSKGLSSFVHGGVTLLMFRRACDGGGG